MSKILVTGGAGFIGSHVAETLVTRGHEVVVLDDLTGGFVDNVPEGARFVHGSVNDIGLVNALFYKEQFEYVFHLAAYAAEGLSHFIKRFNYANNLLGSVNLINASVNSSVKCFVFTSSIAVYGSSPELPMHEQMPPRPEDSYGVAKFAVEQELEMCRQLFGLDHIIFRPHNVYGERQNIGDKYRNVVGIFMNQILQRKPMTIFGDGSQCRAFSYIADVATPIADSIDVPEARNQTFNIGADQPYTVQQLALAIARAMEVEPAIVHLAARNEVLAAYSSHAKLRQVFGGRTPRSLEEGLARMANWVKRHGARSSRDFENIEITRNFPQAWVAAHRGPLRNELERCIASATARSDAMQPIG